MPYHSSGQIIIVPDCSEILLFSDSSLMASYILMVPVLELDAKVELKLLFLSIIIIIRAMHINVFKTQIINKTKIAPPWVAGRLKLDNL